MRNDGTLNGGEVAGAPAANSGRPWFFLAAAGLFVLFCLTYLMRPIMEPDFFWHLKTGEWIWQHKALPGADPFSFMGPQAPDARQLVILQGYWLAQLLFHAAVAMCGFWGILLLRILLLAGFFGLFLWMFERYCCNRVLAFALLILFGVFFLENYALERPQVFTFAAIGLLVILYRHARQHLASAPHLAPMLAANFLLLAVWANLHGGVLLGQGALAVMALVETVLFLQTRERRRFLRMLLFLGAGLAGSLLAPSQLGLGEILSLIGVSQQSLAASQSQVNYEYYSVFTWLFVQKNFKLLIPVAISLTCLFAVREALRQRNYVEIALLAGFWYFAYRHVRYLPVALVFSLLFIAWHYRPEGWLRHAAYPLLAGALCSLWLWTGNEFDHLARTRSVGLVDPLQTPEGAADYLEKQQFRGRILNTINWGGYLMWRLGPEVQVAGDGRVLDVEAYNELSQLWRTGGDDHSQPLWKTFVDRHQVDVAVVPLTAGRSPVRLTREMSGDSEWRQAYQDQTAAVFVRRTVSR